MEQVKEKDLKSEKLILQGYLKTEETSDASLFRKQVYDHYYDFIFLDKKNKEFSYFLSGNFREIKDLDDGNIERIVRDVDVETLKAILFFFEC